MKNINYKISNIKIDNIDQRSKKKKTLTEMLKLIMVTALSASIGHFCGYQSSKSLSDLQTGNDIKKAMILQKLNINNKIDSKLYKLKNATITLLDTKKNQPTISYDECKQLKKQLKLNTVENNFITSTHDVSYYFGNSAKTNIRKLTSWYDQNIKTCFSKTKSPEEKMESLISAYQHEVRQHLYKSPA